MLKELAEILKNTEDLARLRKAESLEANSSHKTTLHLRNLKLKVNEVIAISKILERDKEATNCPITSISLSYNPSIGDKGASAIVRNLPSSISEIGLVDCGISDAGGIEILHWMNTAPNLKMICIEQNSFSEKIKLEFKRFSTSNPQILVIL